MATPPVILTIDRNTRNLALLQRFLSEHGFQVLPVSSIEAIDEALCKSEQIRLAMVDIAGFDRRIWERCEQMRDAGIPFLVLSPQQRAAYQEESLRHGARGMLTKPLAQRELLVLLHSLLGESASDTEE